MMIHLMVIFCFLLFLHIFNDKIIVDIIYAVIDRLLHKFHVWEKPIVYFNRRFVEYVG